MFDGRGQGPRGQGPRAQHGAPGRRTPAVAPWSWAERHPMAAGLEAAAPDAVLAVRLSTLVPVELDAPALVEAVAAWERMVAWATAQQAALLAELHRRDAGSAVGGVSDEVAVRLAVSGRAGQLMVERAVALDRSPRVAEALRRGDLDVRKAQALVHETEHLPSAVAQRVQAAVLGRAPSLTVPQLRAAIRRAELTLAPEATGLRRVAARAERCVRMVPTVDAMAWVHALLPAEDAVAVMGAIGALAARVAPGDDRGVDARRADAFAETFRRVLDGGLDLDGRPLPVRPGRHAHLSVTVNASTLAGLDQTPAMLAGYGPIPADVARRIAADAQWQPVAAHPTTGELAVRGGRSYRLPPADAATLGPRASASYRPARALASSVIDRDVTCTFPGCRIPATSCDLDHRVPFDPRRPAIEQTTEANLHALCRHHHQLKTHRGWRPERDPVTGVTMWTSPRGRVYRRAPVQLDLSRDPPDGAG